VVWIGRFAPEKRLGFMLDVAQKCQSVAFDVLGEGPGSEVEALKRLAESLPNVTLRGYVPHGKVGAYYERAAALVNTSESEGFPNTFLEAWSRRIPVVTTCDPDGVTAEHGLGVVGESVEEMARAVAQVCENDDLRKRLGEAGFAYFKANHTVEAASEAYGKLLEGLVGCGQRVTAAAGKPKFAS
jgi:glycosyltransferase involved in cell wall biosynthesis